MKYFKNLLIFSPIFFLFLNIIIYIYADNLFNLKNCINESTFYFYIAEKIPLIAQPYHESNKIYDNCERSSFIFIVYTFSLSTLFIILFITNSIGLIIKVTNNLIIPDDKKISINMCLFLFLFLLVTRIFSSADNVGSILFSNSAQFSDFPIIKNILFMALCVLLGNVYPMNWSERTNAK